MPSKAADELPNEINGFRLYGESLFKLNLLYIGCFAYGGWGMGILRRGVRDPKDFLLGVHILYPLRHKPFNIRKSSVYHLFS